MEEICIFSFPKTLGLVWEYYKKKFHGKDIEYFLHLVFSLSIGYFCHKGSKEHSSMKTKYQTINRFLLLDDKQNKQSERDTQK